MKAVLQRVSCASVIADGVQAGSIGMGLLVLLGVADGDTETDADLLAAKIAKCRIFRDNEDKMNLSLIDVSGEALVVSNFTLYANYKKGNRPDYLASANPETANRLYEYFKMKLSQAVPVRCGVFGADMDIEMTATGPVTIIMDSAELKK